MKRLLPCLLALAACGGGADEARRPDIVLVTIDTLRPDHLSLYGYERETSPNLDRWFADGRVFERAYSTEGSTSPSVVSILSGQLPQEHGVRLFYQWVRNRTQLLPELLPEEYETAAFVSNIVLTQEAMGIADRFDHYDDFVDESREVFYERVAARTTDSALAWLATERDPRRPLFLWVHYIDPHGPYGPPDGWKRSFQHTEPLPITPEDAQERIQAYTRIEGCTNAMTYVDAYDEEIKYADAEVERLLRACDELVSLDDALLVFTADHGESKIEHERWFTHGYQVYDEILRVPLAIRGPGIEPGRVDGVTSTLDVLPTILSFAGAELPAGLRGIDLASTTSIDPERTVYAEATDGKRQWRAAIRRDGKWVVALERGTGKELGRGRYDLAGDPGELRLLDWTMDDRVGGELMTLIGADPDPGGLPTRYRRGVKLGAPKVAPDVSEEALEKLRALGYAE